MAWVWRGLRDGIVTTRYPRRPDDYGEGFHGTIVVVDHGIAHGDASHRAAASAAFRCPTGAIAESGGEVRVDRGRCILCGRCVAARPDVFAFSSSLEAAAVARTALVVPQTEEDDGALVAVREALQRRVRALRRSIHVRHVDAGSDGSEEWEVAALTNPIYDVQRLGIFFTASPRHADVLLVTGAGTLAMAEPLRATFEAMPDPKVVIAAGTDATSGGLLAPSYATSAGVDSVVPVDVWVPGSPPSPFSLLHGILLGVGLLGSSRPR
ncbi:MAG TPA: ferredoxin [Acidimicrobiales bacterium]|nr:ferredoxin [Acidimicrobiales bacterium]